jgi:hypothetical protein
VAKGQSAQTIKENNSKKLSEKLALRCKSYDPGSTFLGLKVKINKILKTAVIAISSRITLLISTIPKPIKIFVSVTIARGFQIKEYINEAG